MSNKKNPQGSLSNIDRFGIVVGLIGLVADSITLGSLFTISKSTQNSPFYIWLLVLLGIVYTTLLLNFYARKYFHRQRLKYMQEVSLTSYRRIEKGTQYLTFLIGMPMIICYFILAFFIGDSFFFDDLSIYFTDIRLPIARGLFYGGLLSYLICYCGNQFVLRIYEAFDPNYQPTVRKPPSIL